MKVLKTRPRDNSDGDPFFDLLLPRLGIAVGAFVGATIIVVIYLTIPVF